MHAKQKVIYSDRWCAALLVFKQRAFARPLQSPGSQSHHYKTGDQDIQSAAPCLGSVSANSAGEEVLGRQAEGDRGRLVHGEAAAAVEAVEVRGGSQQVCVALIQQILPVVMTCTRRFVSVHATERHLSLH